MKTVLMALAMLFVGIISEAQEKGTFTDARDGKIYKTVKIGTQTWMAENLQATLFNDGTPIPFLTDPDVWLHLTEPAYCWYNNDENFYKEYGALYSWYSVKTGKLAPSGWHVPSDAEWKTLYEFVNGQLDLESGIKLMETGNLHWKQSNNGTNLYGFTALPAGENCGGEFLYIGEQAYWWSTTEIERFDNPAAAWKMTPSFSESILPKCMGLSIRCIKD